MDAVQLAGAIQTVKQGAPRFTTNWFAVPGQIDAWIRRGALFYSAEQGGVLIFRRDGGFYHLYHVAPDHAGVGKILAALGGIAPSAALATDLVGRPDDVGVLAGIYGEHGFEDYRTLCRMVRLADGSSAGYDSDPEVTVAAAPDAPAVHAFLCGLLDPLVDQVPEPEEIRAAVENANILVARCGAEIGGVLVFETAGVTSILRYWYCGIRFRNQGIGARLIRTFFHLCRASRRIILWVVHDNLDAIAKYRRYGFSQENLVDRIMIGKGEYRT